jgi:hypothetical protein
VVCFDVHYVQSRPAIDEIFSLPAGCLQEERSFTLGNGFTQLLRQQSRGGNAQSEMSSVHGTFSLFLNRGLGT